MYHLSLIRCSECNKVVYFMHERAMYTALIMSVRYGKKFKVYRKYKCQMTRPAQEFWHISTDRNHKVSTLARREQRKRRQAKYGLSRKEVGFSS